ncbi:MAG: chitobiase/beta-hexosaminidase C-terminal domain-containing protein, partial [Lachnospiraceae bacterium]|nr:chitobiase/beta-hexosaminidase C-terminal domain-containing protein [Lachnospiraceae bacterium]
MKCQKCGAEIPEGSLYCEKCGQDIHIVPDFKEFAEKKAEDTVKNLLSDLDDDEADFGRSPEGANDEMPVRESAAPVPEKKHRMGWIRFALIAVLTLILVTAGLAFFNRSSGTEYLFEQAREAAEHGDIAKAVGLLEDVEAKESSDVDVLLYLALLYKDNGDTVKYENTLLQVASLPFATSEQNATAYEGLLAIYFESEDYVSMADLLQTCNNLEIKEKYIDYCLMIPEFNLDSGYYGTDQLLKITVPGNARIYYTLDGTEPNEDSFEYIVPLLLTKGEYHIKVSAVNDHGVWSPISEVNYVIESEELYEVLEPSQDDEPVMHEIIDIGNGIYVVDGTPCVLNPETGLFIICGVNIDGAAYIFDDEGQPVLLEIPEDAVRMYTVDDTGNSDPDISGNENT